VGHIRFCPRKQDSPEALTARLTPLATRQVSELQWAMLQAELAQLRNQSAQLTESGVGSCCAQYGFDSKKGKLVASFFFAPKTLNSLTVQEAHKRLGMAAIDAIEGFRAVLTYRLLTHVTIKDTDFEVEFATWDENDGGGRRVFAVYRNGGLELTSPKRK